MTDWSCEWPAPAKLNLFLHITGRRADGYHELQTVFQLLDFGDTLDFCVQRAGPLEIECTDQTLATSDNLAIRAAEALRQCVGSACGARIRLHKWLPSGGGVGGGSSDAATTLLALNALWQCGLDVDALADIGLSLGADIPLFVRGYSAFASGIGERLTPQSLPERYFLVLEAGVAVSTKALFSSSELTIDCQPITMADFVSSGGTNVFEPLVRDRYPEIDRGMRWLEEQVAVDAVQLTGTGGCFYAPFSDIEVPRAILARAPEPLSGFVARSLDRSPVIDRLQLHGVT